LFDGNDRVVFYGRRLRDDAAQGDTREQFSTYNVYWLELDAEAPWNGGEEPAAEGCTPARARVERHLERDLLRVRFPGVVDERTDEIWYWSRLTYLEGAAFELDVDLSDLALPDPGPLALTISLRGWSALPRTLQELDDHEVEVLWNGLPVASARWDNGAGDERIEVAALPGRVLESATNQLTVRVPKRTSLDGEALVDVVLASGAEAVGEGARQHGFSCPDLTGEKEDTRVLEDGRPQGGKRIAVVRSEPEEARIGVLSERLRPQIVVGDPGDLRPGLIVASARLLHSSVP